MPRSAPIQVYHKGFPFSVRPWRTPFGTAGRPEQPLWFIYLTNRQRHRMTGLFPACPDAWYEAARECFDVGYTQLWVLEKVLAVHPVRAQRGGARKRTDRRQKQEKHFPTEEELPRTRWPGRLHAVIRDPYPRGSFHDVVGAWVSAEEAIERAQRYTSAHNRRSVVARLLADDYWH